MKIQRKILPTAFRSRNALFKHQTGKSPLLIIVIAAIAIVIGVISQQSFNTPAKMPKFEKLLIMPTPKSLGEVSLIDHNGAPFTQQNLKDNWTILFFAFTNCPDICPNTLLTLKQVKQDLVTANAWSPFQLAMVSVDPERDTPERLKQYVPFFDPDFIGLTGELDYITKFAKNLGVLFFKKEVLADGNYDVDHSAGLILVNPEGEFAGFMGVPHDRETLSADLSKLGKHILSTQKNSTLDQPEKTVNDFTSEPESAKLEHDGNSKQDIEFINAWIRPAPPSAVSLAGYLTIRNNRKTPLNITGVESTLFNMSMIHETVIEDGVASMNHLDGLKVAPGESVTLAPMGIHMMLMGPKEPLPIGSKVPVTLKLDAGESVELTIEVRNDPSNG